MNNLQPYRTITRPQAVKLILALGRGDENSAKPLTVMCVGPMGSGKSALFYDLQKALPDYLCCFVDCTTCEAGDLLMPVIVDKDTDKPRLIFAPADTMGFHSDKPVMLFADELDKSPRAIQNVFNRVAHEGRLGQYELPKGSFMVATSNRKGEGLGDSRAANMRDRTVSIDIMMPSSSEWIEQYALGANVHPTILTAVSENTQMLQDVSEVSKPEDNPYIFHPDALDREHFTSCRSLDNASRALYRMEREKMGSDVIGHVLAGIVGHVAAGEITATHALHADLPRYDDVLKSPTTAKLPSKSAAICLFVYTAIQRSEPKHIASLMTYMKRLPLEQQAMFFFGLLRTPKAASLTPENGMIEWANENDWTITLNN